MLTSFQLQRRGSRLISWDRKDVLRNQVCTSNLGYEVTPFWEPGLWDWFLRNPRVIVLIIISSTVSLQEPAREAQAAALGSQQERWNKDGASRAGSQPLDCGHFQHCHW